MGVETSTNPPKNENILYLLALLYYLPPQHPYPTPFSIGDLAVCYTATQTAFCHQLTESVNLDAPDSP